MKMVFLHPLQKLESGMRRMFCRAVSGLYVSALREGQLILALDPSRLPWTNRGLILNHLYQRSQFFFFMTDTLTMFSFAVLRGFIMIDEHSIFEIPTVLLPKLSRSWNSSVFLISTNSYQKNLANRKNCLGN